MVLSEAYLAYTSFQELLRQLQLDPLSRDNFRTTWAERQREHVVRCDLLMIIGSESCITESVRKSIPIAG